MEINRLFILVSGILILVTVGGFIMVNLYDVEFLDYVVVRTIIEKIDDTQDPQQILDNFQKYRLDMEAGRISRASYKDAMLAAASYIEKVEVLQQQDIRRIFQYFEKGH